MVIRISPPPRLTTPSPYFSLPSFSFSFSIGFLTGCRKNGCPDFLSVVSLALAARRLLSPSALPQPSVAVSEADLWAYIPGAIRTRLVAGHTGWLAELRRVSVIFVNLPGLGASLETTHQVLRVLQGALYEQEGSVNKLSVDEKGITGRTAFNRLFGVGG